jgi:aspartate/methionine/tyrosine aminotransferase
LFDYLAALENVRTISYRLAYDGAWHIDFDHLRAQISPRSRALVIVNPNNPTGSFLKKSECETLFALAAEYKLPLISDEVFMDYEFGANPDRVKTLASFRDSLSFSLNGLSKAAAMPQMKLAWIVLNGPPAEIQQARKRLELLLDTYLSVNTPVQLALPRLLEIGNRLRSAIRARCQANLQACREILAGTAAHPLYSEGGWSVILQFPQTRTEDEWISILLRDYDVLLQPGFFFDLHGGAFAVASLLPERAVFEEALHRIRNLLAMS